MDLLLNTQEERCRMEVYSEYLRKLPELLKQLDTVEKMYQKAQLEEGMLTAQQEDRSRELYTQRLSRTKQQCEERARDLREQCRLIFALKAEIEAESSALQALMTP